MGTLNQRPNHLLGQTSPYLLQHLYNPVDWYPWSEEALKKASKENKPILVSIGYSACHWCHVMEKESFEDAEVARLMNQYFVCIKVDREERPDIDHLYMNAVQLVSGQGGWPLNCFALPDGRPFWGGTYFPNVQWKSILIRVAELFQNKFKDVEEQAVRITEGVSASSFIRLTDEGAHLSSKDAEAMVDNLMGYMDAEDGGTKGAPKFPLPNNFEFLLHYYYHTGHQAALNQVLLTLRKMAMGGIYDQIGGGFARYSTDTDWKVPHFEKMLYDNAQLISLYSNAYKQAPDPLFKQVVYETIGFVQRELTSPQGLFWSALDADSEGEEGLYYVWTEREFEQVLGNDAPLMKQYFNLGGKGFWEKGQNILLRNMIDEAFAERHNMKLNDLQGKITATKIKLLRAREKRIRPGLDDKILVSWNAMMIKALADAYASFGDEGFLESARTVANKVVAIAMAENGHLFRNLKGDKPCIDGFLEDYAWLSNALIRLFEVSAEEVFLHQASCLVEFALVEFYADDTNLLLFSARSGEKLAAPYFEFHDNVIPASNSIMARNLFYLANYYEKPEWGQRSSEMLRDMRRLLNKYSSSYTNWGMLLLHHVFPYHTLVITGPGAIVQLKQALHKYLPNVLIASSDKANAMVPVYENRFNPEQTLYYVCKMGACKLPVATFDEALNQLS